MDSVNAQTRKAESEGGGVDSVNARTRKADSEGGGVGFGQRPDPQG